MGNVYFFTELPGFIASALITELIANWHPEKIYLLVLSNMKEKAVQDMESITAKLKYPREKWHIVEGDITQPNLALSAEQTEELAQSVTHVFHLAAIYDLAVPEDIAYRVNVQGTKNVNDWLRSFPYLQHYVYFSTAYVSGTRQGVILESELDEGQSFKNHYEKTKFEAEVAVREAAKNIPTTIIRPGIVVGHSQTGETAKFDGPYFILNFLDRLKFIPFFPYFGNGGAEGNFVPVDYVVKAALYLAHFDGAVGKTYHLTDPKPYKVNEVYRMIVKEYLGKEPKGKIPLAAIKGILSIPAIRKRLGTEKEALDYFECMAVYDATEAQTVLQKAGISCPDFRDVIPVMVRYYREHKHAKTKHIPIC
jgi:nucleoside-diphosphate-sugar epimerase